MGCQKNTTGLLDIHLFGMATRSHHVVSLLDGGLVERVSLGEEGAHLLDLRPVVLLALEHGHPRPRVLELANDVHGDARSSRDEDADVVGIEVGARGLGADGGAHDGLGGAELLRSGAGLKGEGPGGGGCGDGSELGSVERRRMDIDVTTGLGRISTVVPSRRRAGRMRVSVRTGDRGACAPDMPTVKAAMMYVFETGVTGRRLGASLCGTPRSTSERVRANVQILPSEIWPSRSSLIGRRVQQLP